nr:glycoside hydrolase family 3 N-terminal domain-containing protein [Arthrobacter sp. Y81]
MAKTAAKTAAAFAVTAAVLASVSCTGVPAPSGSGTSPDTASATPSGSATRSGPADSGRPATPKPSTPAPGERQLGWGPQQKDEDAARAAVAKMSVEQKAGQVLMPFFAGTDFAAHAATMERLHLGGSIVMGDNVPRAADGTVDTAAMAAGLARLQKAAKADGRTWPAIMGVDQEGGVVARLRAPLTEWPAPMSYGAAANLALATDAGKALASELAGLGFNADFAPATDVTAGPQDPTIGARSMSGNADAAASLGAGFAQGMLSAGLLPSAKHFPGHGSVAVDSHESLPVQKATVEQLRAKDWKPFQAAIDAGLPMIMTGHISVPALEPGIPASLSKPSYAALRGMGFKGVAVTDALNMGAVQKQFPDESAAPRALAAGADLLLMPGDVAAAHAAVVSAVKSGTLPLPRLEEAAQRVVTMMMWRARTPAPQGAAPGSGSALSQRVSAAAVTVLAGPCRGAMVPGSVRLAGGSEQDRARFVQAARAAGITVGAGPLVTLIGYEEPPAQGDVVVALDAPWSLAGSAAPAKVALYGRSQEAFNALAAVLAGKATAPGKLPVAVGPFAPGSGC